MLVFNNLYDRHLGVRGILPDSINFQRLTPIIASISHLDMDPDSPLTTTDIRSSLEFAFPSPRAWPISYSVICSISLKPKILPKVLLEILIFTLVMKPFSSKLFIDWPPLWHFEAYVRLMLSHHQSSRRSFEPLS